MTVPLIIAWVAFLAILLVLGSVASYLRLLMRRLTPVGRRVVFQAGAGSRLRADRERVGVSISALHGAAMHLFAVGLTGLLVFLRPEHFWGNLSTALVAVIGAVAICDQLIPFLLVARHDEPEEILRQWVPLLRRGVYVALPLTFPILISTTIRRLLESPEEKPPEPSPEENVQELIQAGEQEGILERADGEMIQSVVRFGDTVVREVMRPRPEIAGIDINAPIDELRRVLRAKRYTRYPVYDGQLDAVEGIVSVRDLMELQPEEQMKVTVRSLVRPVLFVPETKPVNELLKELQQLPTQMAMVIDEYGSVTGLVTIEDLLEEIVGEIRDEVEPHARDIVREAAGSYLVAGRADLAEVAEELEVALAGEGYATVAGLLLSQLGHVPRPGEKVEKQGVIFEVLEANQRTVLKVRLRQA
jgi:CBS domain containing-hemolysin-like protein